MTHEELAEYAERVKGPGKFEGGPSYVPYFWDTTWDNQCYWEEDCTKWDSSIPHAVIPVVRAMTNATYAIF